LEKSESIPYGRQDITEEDIKAVIKVLRSDFLTQGPSIPAFEEKLCNYTGTKYSVAVNSCTSALHIACLALNLGPGDVLWTSPISFVASANCALYCGALVDFVDIEPDTALMSVQALEDKLKQAEQQGNLPKIVIPVHFAGQSCDMEAISKLGKKYNFRVIEDAAHAIGARYLNRTVGCCQYSDITVFSFHPVKVITTGEGGAALTNNLDVAKKMQLLRSHGITRDSKEMNNSNVSDWYYEQISLGFNYRMTDFQAALGISQLSRLDEYVAKRSKIAHWYDDQFEKIPVNPLIQKENGESSHHLYVLRIKNGEDERNKLYKYLRKNDIYVNLHYMPIYRQPYFNRKIRLLGAEEYYKSAISLPIFPTIGKNNLKKVMQKISEFYGYH
jgi:UDP-4-amino-4,6-dideoxy-N-acetyl-beta-L-altrosamine transaminase